MNNAYRILIIKSEGKRLLERRAHRRQDKIKTGPNYSDSGQGPAAVSLGDCKRRLSIVKEGLAEKLQASYWLDDGRRRV
jgi:hypothetical protein